MAERELWRVREAAQYLGLNEKVVYRLIRERGLPATKVTGKWLFSKTLIDGWLEEHLESRKGKMGSGEFTLLACSDDPLLALTVAKSSGRVEEYAIFTANVGSSIALEMLVRHQVGAAGAHLIEPESDTYNLPYLESILDEVVIITFVERTQGIVTPRGNPGSITSLRDIADREMTLLTRQPGSGTHKLLQGLLSREGISLIRLENAANHFEIGRRICSGEAQAGFSIEAVARVFGLNFIPVKKERYDLILLKEQLRYQSVKRLISFIGTSEFETLSRQFGGYDCKLSGKLMVA
jgi:excisionase family DNA binding protein